MRGPLTPMKFPGVYEKFGFKAPVEETDLIHVRLAPFAGIWNGEWRMTSLILENGDWRMDSMEKGNGD